MKDDMISRQAAISEIMEDIEDRSLHDDPAIPEDYAEGYDEGIRNAAAIVLQMPPAQPNLSEAYSKAVFTWLMDYQIRTAELKGRYTPYEVLSWVISDWRKENE